jgi:hypothetical protein
MNPTLIRLYEGRTANQCRGCQADIFWFETLNGKRMPMNAGAVSRKSEFDATTRRTILYFSSEDSHWATCPARARFARRRSTT